MSQSNEKLEMKTLTYNSNAISLVPNRKVHSEIWCLEGKKPLSKTQKRLINGKVKTFLGVAYFITLMYFLFVLLT